MKRTILATALALGLAASTSASAIVVGGVDFGSQGLLQHIDTTTFANTWVSPGGAGTTTYGYGVVSTINGTGDYCASGSCALYFTYEANVDAIVPVGFPAGSSALILSGSKYNFFIDTTAGQRNLLDFDSVTNLAFINSLDLWAAFTGHAPGYAAAGTSDYYIQGTYSGGTGFAGTGAGLADVVLGEGVAGVAEFLDSNSEADTIGGFADIKITSSVDSSKNNSNDTCTFVDGQWCMQGSSNIRGGTNPIPEPGSLALLGLGVLGLGLARRRKAA